MEILILFIAKEERVFLPVIPQFSIGSGQPRSLQSWSSLFSSFLLSPGNLYLLLISLDSPFSTRS